MIEILGDGVKSKFVGVIEFVFEWDSVVVVYLYFCFLFFRYEVGFFVLL